MTSTVKKYFLFIFLLVPFSLNAQNVIWIDGVSQVIQTIGFNGANLGTLDTSIGAAFGIAADLTNNKLFWVDNTAKAIMSASLDGSNVQAIVTQGAADITIPRGIAVNVQAKKIYWTDNGLRELLSANYDGSGVAVLDTGLDSPGFAAFDSSNQKIYWADNGSSAKKIQCCDLNGTNVHEVVTGLNQLWGIAVDEHAGTLYWIDSGIEKIQKASLSGTLPAAKVDVITNLTGSQRGLTIDEKTNYMYWSSTNGEIMKAKLDGTVMAVVDSGINYPQGITLIDSLLTVSGVRDAGAIPKRFELYQNYPNPFNPTTVIKYSVPVNSFVTLKIYDVLGRQIASLVNQIQKNGDYNIKFSSAGAQLASGIYFYRLQAHPLVGGGQDFIETKKLILLK